MAFGNRCQGAAGDGGQGRDNQLVTITTGQATEYVWKASNLWFLDTQALKNVCVSLVALVLIQPTICKWQAKSRPEILISVTVRDDDNAVNGDMVRGWVLGTGRRGVVVEVFRCHHKSSLPTQRNLPEDNCVI